MTNAANPFAFQADTAADHSARALGLSAANANRWTEALLHLNAAARQGQVDLMVLDALGEAAYRTNVPEALGPYQNYYKYPLIASHMARAFLMLGDRNSCTEFLGWAKESALKSALLALLQLGEEISTTAAHFFAVAEKHPDLFYPEYWRALSAVADAVGREDLTHLSERKSKAFAYTDPNIHFNQALRMLGQGEFRAGWRLYEWRLVPNASQSNRTELGTISMWEGEKLPGKKLLIYLEQGFGDGIFALRYVPALLEQGARLEIVARPAILSLIQSTYPEIKTHNEDEVAVVGYWDKISSPADFWVYGLSIPFRAGLWRPIQTSQFLKAPTPLTKKFAEKIRSLNPLNLPVYSVNWHGRIDTESDRTRAFSVQEFCQITALDQAPCVFISLQKEASAQEIEFLEKAARLTGGVFINAAPELSDFAVTAAWISASDRLLTCDTSVAHVGGALGHPTTVFARNKAIWQWRRLESEQDIASPAVWYDSVLVQYALAPKISWLFTTLNKPPNKPKGLTDDKSSPPEKNPELSETEIRTSGRRGLFRFAGRTDPS